MRTVSLLRLTGFGAAFLLSTALSQAASPDAPAKPPPRLPPSPTEANRIPSGVDTGSPVTSDALPLGTPVPPNSLGGAGDSKLRSAAARAAARPHAAGSSAVRSDGVVPPGPAPLSGSTDARDPTATATPSERRVAPRSGRSAASAPR